MNKSLIISAIITALLIGIGIGYYFSPTYSDDQIMSQADSMIPLGNADALIDKRYLKNVIAHHMAAIHLAQQTLSNSNRQEVKALSQAIIDGDTESIRTLNEWRLQWYNDASPIFNYEQINLGSTDDNFDLRFINAMVSHHESAIAMASEIMGKSTRNEVLTEASKIKQFLSGNLITLKEWRSKWYGI